MTKFQMSLFNPVKIENAKKIASEDLQGKIPAAALKEMFPFDVKLEPTKPEPEAFKEEAPPLPGAGVDHWEEKPVPEAAAAPPEDFPEEENKSAGEVPEQLPEEEGKKPACENGETHWKELLEKAVSLHRDNINSIREAVRECHEILGKILEAAPDSLAEAYYGSAAAESCGCGKYPVTVENVPTIVRDEKEEELVQKGKELQQAAATGGSMNKGSGEPPVCAAPDEVQSAFVGIPFSIDLVASDPGGLITGIEVVTLPLWAALNIITVLPSPDAVARISGTPGSEDKGLHVMQIAATNSDGNQSVSPLKIKVDDYGFTDDQPGLS